MHRSSEEVRVLSFTEILHLNQNHSSTGNVVCFNVITAETDLQFAGYVMILCKVSRASHSAKGMVVCN